jgi:hypothetical protein
MDAIVVVLTAITRSSANRNGWESLSNSDLRLIAISKKKILYIWTIVFGIFKFAPVAV